MENTAWEKNEYTWILRLAKIATITGAMQEMREKNVYYPSFIGDGSDEEDRPGDLSQAWPSGIPDNLSSGGENRYMFGWAVDKTTIWNAVQKTASEIDFKLDPNELPRGEADGTGIGIKNIAKRGKELKVFVQYKKGGGVRVAGLDLGNYNGSWKKLFHNSIEIFNSFSHFLLITDGDTAILDGLKTKIKIIFQRCLWHIPHQAKYVLWQDSVKHKSGEWLYVLSELMEICAIRPFVDCDQIIKTMLESKRKRLEKVIRHCQEKGYTHVVSYLENARPDMFTALKNRLNGKTTSRVERVMRTVNMRANVSKWSKEGALNVTKVRLAYYYNDFDA